MIAWIDNGGDPPAFPTTAFPDVPALSAYIEGQNGKMAVIDTGYQGAFMRQSPGQLPTQPGNGAETGPDIIVTGVAAAQDASAFVAGYNDTTPHNQAVLGMRNFVYVRALNTRSGSGRSRVYFYHMASGSPSPIGWESGGFTVAGQPQNWIDVIASAGGQVMVPAIPLVWDTPTVPDGQSLILIAWVDDSANPKPPDFSNFGYLTPEVVKDFVTSTPRLSWLALSGSAAPSCTAAWQLPVSQTGSLYAGVQLSNLPIGGTLAFSLPGPDAANTLVKSFAVPEPNAAVVWPVVYPAGFASSIVVTYTQGSGQPPGPPDIKPVFMTRSVG